MTRIQKERFPDPNEYEKVKGSYRITKSTALEGQGCHRAASSSRG